jgi:hypothetical protein
VFDEENFVEMSGRGGLLDQIAKGKKLNKATTVYVKNFI